MEKENCLSEKRICVNGRTENFHYKEPDVKEAVRRLKERINDKWTHSVIDEIFGEKLSQRTGRR